MKLKGIRKNAGFSLAETLVAAAVSSLVLAGIASGAIALRRTYESATYHMTAQTEQLRVFDYVGRDVKSASSYTVLDNGRRLDLTIPADNPGVVAMTLTLPVVGTLRTAAAPSRAVSYVVEGDRLLRTENGRTKEVARTVTEFNVIRSGMTVDIIATFSPRFCRSPLTAAQQATRLRSTFLCRNEGTN